MGVEGEPRVMLGGGSEVSHNPKKLAILPSGLFKDFDSKTEDEKVVFMDDLRDKIYQIKKWDGADIGAY